MDREESPVNKGNLLIAEPYMLDPNFKRSVVLMTFNVEEEGSFGFILNKPTDKKLNDFLETSVEVDMPLFFGGPIQLDAIHYLHRAGHLLEDSVEVAKGLYWGGNFDQLRVLMREQLIKESDIRFFIGFSSWEASQLNDELAEGSWIVSSYDENYLFNTKSEQLWAKVLSDMGAHYSVMADIPDEPTFN